MKQLIIATMLILTMMSGIAVAEQREDWPHEQRNIIPDHIEGVRYDFEEGSNCGTFDNQFPYIATFLTVEGGHVPIGYGPCYPSYNTVGGSMCGNCRCFMNIYPYSHYENWTIVVNGNSAFSPKTCCESDPSICWTGNCYPGPCAEAEFKEGTRYISFLASTDGALRIILRDKRDSIIHYERIYTNTARIHPDPSNFTQFSYHSDNVDIASMELTGVFNGWIMDDLIVGGNPGYLPDMPTDYAYAAERLKELIGLDYLQYGTAWDYVFKEYRTAEEMLDDIPDPYPDLAYKPPELEFGIGIDDQDAILFAFNNEETIVNWWDTNKMAKADFTEHVDHKDIQPGDVFFIDYPQEYPDGIYGPDGCYDEVGMVIEPMIDPATGKTVDIIRIIPEAGVHYSTSEHINDIYGIDGFVDYRSLPNKSHGKHQPYKKMPLTKLI